MLPHMLTYMHPTHTHMKKRKKEVFLIHLKFKYPRG